MKKFGDFGNCRVEVNMKTSNTITCQFALEISPYAYYTSERYKLLTAYLGKYNEEMIKPINSILGIKLYGIEPNVQKITLSKDKMIPCLNDYTISVTTNNTYKLKH